MSRYNKLIKEILDGIFAGYALDEDNKLKVVDEAATKTADAALHKLVLEKSRDLWDQLEAAEGSLQDVAEEITFEELNADPSSVDMTLTTGGNEPETPDVDAAAMGAEPTLENLLGSDDFNFNSVFEVLDANEPPMADGGPKDEPTMMEQPGDEEEEDVVDGDEDFTNLEVGMDDNDMGSSDMEGDPELDDLNGDPELGGPEDDLNGDPELDDLNGDPEMDLEPEGGDELGLGDEFDFDLGLGDEDPNGDIEGLAPEDEEVDTDEGYGAKPYRMEDKGKK